MSGLRRGGMILFEEDLRRISEYYFHARYPGRMAIDYPREEIKKSLDTAGALVEILLEGRQI